MLNEKETKKLEVIKKVIAGELTRKEAADELDLSTRQVDRLKKGYEEYGEEAFSHKGRGKPKRNKTPQKLIEEIEDLYMTEFFDYNFEHFYEEIKDEYPISYDLLLKRFKEDDIISPLAHKKTVKAYQEKMERYVDSDTKDDEEEEQKIELYKSRIVEVEKAHVRRSNNMYCFGQEIQMDACVDNWFGDVPSYLHLAVDKATKKVLYGWFEFEEVTRAYYVLLYNIVAHYGIPAKIKTDNRSTFAANIGKNKNKKSFLTQFGKVCETLDIVLETSSNPTSKPNVERTNGTFKNRLRAELRHQAITSIDEANQYLNEIFIHKMNEMFSYRIDEKRSMMRKNEYTERELKLIISEKYNRVIDNASSISFDSKYYVPTNDETGMIVSFMRSTKCVFIIDYDGEYWAEIENHYYKMIELESRDLYQVKENKEKLEAIKKERHGFTPPADHPWRKSNN